MNYSSDLTQETSKTGLPLASSLELYRPEKPLFKKRGNFVLRSPSSVLTYILNRYPFRPCPCMPLKEWPLFSIQACPWCGRHNIQKADQSHFAPHRNLIIKSFLSTDNLSMSEWMLIWQIHKTWSVSIFFFNTEVSLYGQDFQFISHYNKKNNKNSWTWMGPEARLIEFTNGLLW